MHHHLRVTCTPLGNVNIVGHTRGAQADILAYGPTSGEHGGRLLGQGYPHVHVQAPGTSVDVYLTEVSRGILVIDQTVHVATCRPVAHTPVHAADGGLLLAATLVLSALGRRLFHA